MEKLVFKTLTKNVLALLLITSGMISSAQESFPAILPLEKPNENISAATERLYDNWDIYGDKTNELFSNFLYTNLKGFSKGVGASRRDPTKVIKVGDTYYVWYTHRKTESPPAGRNFTDEIPSSDWDLADLYYATSKDGFVWEEQGLAVARPPKGEHGWRALTTPGILVWKGKYYLYYQSFNQAPSATGDRAEVRVAQSDSPDGPWKIVKKEIINYGEEGDWDFRCIHDPCPIVYKDKIYIYYKSQNGAPREQRNIGLSIAGGVAIADDPLGPFVKSPLNPILNSGHEISVFPFKGGVAAFVSLNGPEKNTIQYSPDGVNFEIASHVILPPIAPAPYVPDAFTNTDDGRGITWGLCHIGSDNKEAIRETMLMRFDCDLSRDVDDPAFKRDGIRFPTPAYLEGRFVLPEDLKKKRMLDEH
ncbi:glycoside hydrolase family 117 protein [Bacteroidota bacterium]